MTSHLSILKLAVGGLVASAALGAMAQEGHAPAHAHWDYRGKLGTKAWGDLEPGFATCKLGKHQSPVNIKVSQAKKAALEPIHFGYTGSTGEVVNTGHTVQVNLAEGGNIGLAEGEFKLVQFHFHTPSEERIDGKAYPMVVHMVHKNDAGQLAVVAVLLKEGKENAALKPVFDALPGQPGQAEPLKIALNPADLLPARHDYYHFTGSLTTPPCSEDVSWQVLRQPVEISKGQLAAFRKLYRMNARPVQPLNDRVLEQS